MKYLNLSGNNFYGKLPRLGFRRPLGFYAIESYMYELEELIINDNDFFQILSVPEECTKLKIVNAENNRFDAFSLRQPIPLEKVNLKNNKLYYQNFFLGQWKKSEMPDLSIKELDISHNDLNFGSLWWFSDPRGDEHYGEARDSEGNIIIAGNPGEYWNILYEPGVTVTYAPQDSLVLQSVNAKKIRSTVGGSFFVELPDVGQRNDGLWSMYPEIIDSLDFQWYKDGVALETDTFPDLTRTSVTAGDFGRYHCEIKSKTNRLKDLVLYTESFVVANEENLPPVLSIRNGQQTERFKVGHTSSEVRLYATDDVEWDGQSIVMRRGGFEIIQYPQHLQYIGYNNIIKVQSTDPMWTGRDSIEVSCCDYEGACDSIKLYYEVYDDLYSPDITQVSATADKKMTVEWDAGFYDTKIEKPDGYRLVINVQMEGFAQPVDTITVDEPHINSIEFNIPEREFEYQLHLQLYAYNSKGQAPYSSLLQILAIPVIADTDLQITTSSDSQVELEWTLASIMNMENHPYNLSAFPQEYQDMLLSALIGETRCRINNNIIYRSVDGGVFEAIDTLASANDGYCLPVETTYTDTTIEAEHIYRYKLVKQTVSLIPFLQIELPYLESNIVELDLRSEMIITAVPQTTVNNEIQLYPNPAKNHLVVMKENTMIHTIEIMDNSGKLQKRFNNLENEQNNISLDISQLSSGVYLVKIITPEGTITKKLIKE